MFELFTPRNEFDPSLEYSEENCPPRVVQAEFFAKAFMEGAEIDRKSRIVAGPFYNDFVQVMKKTDEMVKRINPTFTVEHIAPSSYRSPQVKKEVNESGNHVKNGIFEVAQERLRLLEAVANDKIINEVSDQLLSSDLLAVPGYCRQGGEWEHDNAARGCTIACFRMVFGKIAGWTPSETVIGNQLIRHYGTSIVEDSVFQNVFNTEIFSEICDKSVISLELIGADLDLIAGLTNKIKLRQENADVFCIVNLGSETANHNTWHTSVLLEAGPGTVTCHDPSGTHGGARKVATKTRFLTRWAATYNRAQLIIAV